MLHGFFATMEALTSVGSHPPALTGIARLLPSMGNAPPGAWAIVQAVSLAAIGIGTLSASCARQISLLFSFELLTIPSPTTALPFLHGRFLTLLHRRELPRLSSGQTFRSVGFCLRAVKGSDIPEQPPRQAWPNRVHLRYGLVIRLRLLSTFPHGKCSYRFRLSGR